MIFFRKEFSETQLNVPAKEEFIWIIKKSLQWCWMVTQRFVSREWNKNKMMMKKTKKKQRNKAEKIMHKF